ncbi:MAG: four-carbon acid sugar kinase family protein [Terracidiphilus sp.]|nr:four-carbon acid sugar kinase family protein [Terracidiphilus sp.]
MTDSKKKLYAWYGDDFTGSTDVLERLALSGIPTVLFTAPPTEAALATFSHCRAIGIAGESRSQSPAWMDAHLPAVFERIKSFGAAVNHYKVCSTFDSSPTVGSIGRAIELGLQVFEQQSAPVVVGAPHLSRWVVFGNLFAADRGQVFRIDRHPNMCNHPVTPMHEADLAEHLRLQTNLPIGRLDLAAFQSGHAQKQFHAQLAGGARIVVFDGVDAATLAETGRMIMNLSTLQPLFAVGSSGLTYGLLEQWRNLGLLGAPPQLPPPSPVDRLLVLSGSCSPVTARQIQQAMRQGFSTFHLDPATDWNKTRHAAEDALRRGQSVVLYTALGPNDSKQPYGAAFSASLGAELRTLLLSTGIRRVLVAGGDTSTHAVQQLGLQALTFSAPLVAGAPLCLGHAPGSPLHGLELVLKGGQIGPEGFFAQVRNGQLN